MNLPKISIITISLNSARTIEKTIRSVINQRYNNMEYIIIDGGSVDGTIDIIKKYSDQITYWISEPDKGIYNAMNKGIAHAKGDYCNFMNAGDFFFDNDVLYNVFDKGNASEDIIVGNTIFKKKIRHPRKEISLLELYTNLVNHQATFIKNNILSKYLYDEKYMILSDWKFLVQALILDNCSYRAIDVNIVYFDNSGISTSNEPLLIEEMDKIMKELFSPRICSDYKKFKYYYWIHRNPMKIFSYIWKKIKYSLN